MFVRRQRRLAMGTALVFALAQTSLFAAGGGILGRVLSEGAQRGLTEAGQRGLTEAAQRGLTEAGQRGLTEAGQRGLTEAGQRGLTEAGQRGLTEAGQRGLTEAGQRGLTEAGQRGLTDGGERIISGNTERILQRSGGLTPDGRVGTLPRIADGPNGSTVVPESIHIPGGVAEGRVNSVIFEQPNGYRRVWDVVDGAPQGNGRLVGPDGTVVNADIGPIGRLRGEERLGYGLADSPSGATNRVVVQNADGTVRFSTTDVDGRTISRNLTPNTPEPGSGAFLTDPASSTHRAVQGDLRPGEVVDRVNYLDVKVGDDTIRVKVERGQTPDDAVRAALADTGAESADIVGVGYIARGADGAERPLKRVVADGNGGAQIRSPLRTEAVEEVAEGSTARLTAGAVDGADGALVREAGEEVAERASIEAAEEVAEQTARGGALGRWTKRGLIFGAGVVTGAMIFAPDRSEQDRAGAGQTVPVDGTQTGPDGTIVGPDGQPVPGVVGQDAVLGQDQDQFRPDGTVIQNGYGISLDQSAGAQGFDQQIYDIYNEDPTGGAQIIPGFSN